jgi:hypothetical protein
MKTQRILCTLLITLLIGLLFAKTDNVPIKSKDVQEKVESKPQAATKTKKNKVDSEKINVKDESNESIKKRKGKSKAKTHQKPSKPKETPKKENVITYEPPIKQENMFTADDAKKATLNAFELQKDKRAIEIVETIFIPSIKKATAAGNIGIEFPANYENSIALKDKDIEGHFDAVVSILSFLKYKAEKKEKEDPIKKKKFNIVEVLWN